MSAEPTLDLRLLPRDVGSIHCLAADPIILTLSCDKALVALPPFISHRKLPRHFPVPLHRLRRVRQ
jgi:hypothetical protein